MKLIVAGSRDFNDWDRLNLTLRKIHERIQINEIVSGGARGADKLGERFASENGIPVISFIPDWDRYGKSAGFRRNVQMSEYGDALVAFWDGKSPGTRSMIELANEKRLKVLVIHG